MPEVSIIIPVYNAENCIRRCVESVLEQEYKDFELILMDDGSKDGCPAVLDELAAKDERITVVHQANAGVSATRNRAMDLARGKYIQFLDADDWMTKESTKLMVRTAEETGCDLVVGEFYRVVKDNLSIKGSILSDKVLTLREYAEYMMEGPADYYYGVLWNKLYRRSIIEEYGIRMDESLSFCEDFVFNLNYLRHCRTVAPLQAPVYYYVKTEGSLVATNLTLPKIYKMKTTVFQYYDDFYKSILDEETYSSQWLSIAGFLFDAARDEMTIPMMPGTLKLGEELIQAQYCPSSASLPSLFYYMDKTYDRYLDTLSKRSNLSVKDLRIYDAVHHSVQPVHQKALSDFTGYTLLSVLSSLEKLSSRGYVTLYPSEGEILAEEGKNAEKANTELANIAEDLFAVMFEGLSEAEMKEWLRVSDRIHDNLRKAMSSGEEQV